MTKKGIYRNKNQALYRFLPNNWVNYRDNNDDQLGDASYTIKIKNWNTKPLNNVYTNKVSNEIFRLISLFASKGGNIGSFNLNDKSSLAFLQAAENEGIPDILGDIDPLLFYCSKCGMTQNIRNSTTNFKRLSCPNSTCQVKLKQLQMIYSCECGFAQGVTLPYNNNIPLLYRPNKVDANRSDSFKFFYRDHEKLKPKEMILPCPQCGLKLYPRNAVDRVNYRTHSIKTVNLIDRNEGKLFEQGTTALELIVCRWLNEISHNDYNKILQNQENFFKMNEEEAKSIDAEIEKTLDSLNLSGNNRASFKSALLLQRNKSLGTEITMVDIQRIFDKYSNDTLQTNLTQYASVLVEYMTLRYPKRVITIEDSIKRALEMENIDNENEVLNINKKIGVEDAQLSYDIELLFSTYGYTRKYINPKDAKRSLKLNAFSGQSGKSNIYNTLLDTEGVLMQFDRVKILKWLRSNEIITEEEMPILSEIGTKSWFLENIDLSRISYFSSIVTGNINGLKDATAMVYLLLHTISHLLIKSASTLSGLDKDSISEIIFPSVPAIFIYSNSSQGVALGALSGMFEQNYLGFIQSALSEGSSCMFDPICDERDNAACSSCLYLSEVSCSSFNNDLSRHILFGKHHFKGFWE